MLLFMKGHLQFGLRLLLQVYYFLRPAIPQGLRFTLRHLYAAPLKNAVFATWPIHPNSKGVPADWPGWPDGKRFAFALSHDVEGIIGLQRCRKLAELEMKLGFRSSFNFVPKGEYNTPPDLRRFLTENGFEVGIHDLHHDGSLYRSRRSFSDSAVKINEYLKEWNAVGFRSGFMRHDLDWIGDLNIRYDASTFDHDPFEPQPDGVHTIFPFWVRREDGTAFLELPYTLAQDSTLFLVLREKGTEVWKRKLDWIAEHGGMAFVIVHPDYTAFDETQSSKEYNVALYQELLEYVSDRYQDSAWFARPRDIERYLRKALPMPGHGSAADDIHYTQKLNTAV